MLKFRNLLNLKLGGGLMGVLSGNNMSLDSTRTVTVLGNIFGGADNKLFAGADGKLFAGKDQIIKLQGAFFGSAGNTIFAGADNKIFIGK